MRIAVVGATGGIGRHVVDIAVDGGHEVRALARDASKITRTHERLEVVQGDVTDPEAIDALVPGCELVLSCLGTRRPESAVVATGTRRILEGMERHGVERVAIISSVGVRDSERQAALASRVFRYLIMPTVLRTAFRDLTEAEVAVEASTRTGILVRPTGLSNGAGTGRWVATHAADHGSVTTRIARQDVARFLVSLTTDTQFDGTAVSVFGA
jgi:uncharacterized protein YbjT (DUF2867 family)